MKLGVPKRRVAPKQLLAGRPGAIDAREQLIDEAQRASRAGGRPFAQAHVQDLAGARSEHRVIAAFAGVTERRALLGIAVDLADEAVDIDHQASRAGARPRRVCPRALAQAPLGRAFTPR